MLSRFGVAVLALTISAPVVAEEPSMWESIKGAFKSDATKAEEWNEKGKVALRRSRHREAADAFAKAIELQPKVAKYYYNLGAAYGNSGRHETATLHFQKALDLQPHFPEASRGLSLARRSMDAERAEVQAGEIAAALQR